MLDVPIPDLEWTDASLALDARIVRGERAAAPERLSDKIRVGLPLATSIDDAVAAGDDAMLAALAAGLAAESRFHLVSLGCTFEPDDEFDFERAWVRVEFTSDTVPPIAWSMLPEREVRPLTVTKSISLNPQIKLVGAVAEAATVGATKSFQRDEIFIEALNLNASDPTWIFARTESCEIRGAHRLFLITRSVRGGRANGSVSLRAELRHRGLFRRFAYKVELPARSAASFDL